MGQVKGYVSIAVFADHGDVTITVTPKGYVRVRKNSWDKDYRRKMAKGEQP